MRSTFGSLIQLADAKQGRAHIPVRLADQVTDILFITGARSVDRDIFVYGLLFISSFALVTVGRALVRGPGLTGALLAATGAELAVRYARHLIVI